MTEYNLIYNYIKSNVNDKSLTYIINQLSKNHEHEYIELIIV